MARRGIIGTMPYVTNVWTQILGASPRRRHVVVNNPSAGVLWVFAGAPGVNGNGQGLVLTTSSGHIDLDYRDVGTLVCLPWFVMGSVTSITGWVEAYDDSDLPP